MTLARLACGLWFALILAVCQSADDRSQGCLLPPGDPAAGRQAFVELRCWACHGVAGDAEMPKPNVSPPAPTLDADAGRVVSGAIATSIVIPSHAISSKKGPWREDELSPMGDYTDAMTARQLIDLVAFIKSLANP